MIEDKWVKHEEKVVVMVGGGYEVCSLGLSLTKFPAILRKQSVIEPEIDQTPNRVAYTERVCVCLSDVLGRKRVAIIAMIAPGVGLPARRSGCRGVFARKTDGDLRGSVQRAILVSLDRPHHHKASGIL